MMEQLGDRPVEPKYRELMRSMGQYIDRFFNDPGKRRKTGFVLLVFPFEDHHGRCNYISNAKRDDVVVMLKEQIKRFEGQPEITGRG